MALNTLAAIKLQLGVTGTDDDALLESLAAAAESHIDEVCGRSFTGGTFTEDHAGAGRLVFLRNYPVVEVTEVRVDSAREFADNTVMNELSYFVHPDAGLVESLGRPFVMPRPGWADKIYVFPGTVRVTYTTAEDAVPPAVQRAYAELVGHWYRQAKTFAATEQLNVLQQTDGTTVTQYPWAQSGGFKLPPGVVQLLEPYRVPRV